VKKIKRVFGGDAAEQRACAAAVKSGGEAVALDVVPFAIVEAFGLDAFYRDSEGQQYSHAVLVETK